MFIYWISMDCSGLSKGVLPRITTFCWQNWHFLPSGIKVTLENMPDNGVILAVTDAGTKMMELEESIQKKILEKNVKIFFAFSPFCQARCSNSIPVYKRLSQGRMFNLTDFDQETFFQSVVHTVWKFHKITLNCKSHCVAKDIGWIALSCYRIL